MERRYKIGEFARMLDISIETLRRWDKEKILEASRTITGHRYYTDEHLEQAKSRKRK